MFAEPFVNICTTFSILYIMIFPISILSPKPYLIPGSVFNQRNIPQAIH